MTSFDRPRANEETPTRPLEITLVKYVPFNFRLGEWKLLSLARPLVVLEAEPGFPGPDWAPEATDAADGYLINGLKAPVDEKFLAPPPGWKARLFREYPRYLVDLTIGFEAYMGAFSGKTRSTLKRKLRKFHELSGGVAVWKQYRTPAEMTDFFSLARVVSQKTYQERLLGVGLPNSDAFIADASKKAAHGQVRGFILYLHEHPVSYLYLPVEGGRVIYAYLGYDPAVAEHSPGTVLQLLAMETLFGEPGLTVFDFTQGEGQHKQLFSTHAENCADVLLTRRGTLTGAIAGIHAAFVRAESTLSAWLARMGLRDYLKKLLRRSVQ